MQFFNFWYHFRRPWGHTGDRFRSIFRVPGLKRRSRPNPSGGSMEWKVEPRSREWNSCGPGSGKWSPDEWKVALLAPFWLHFVTFRMPFSMILCSCFCVLVSYFLAFLFSCLLAFSCFLVFLFPFFVFSFLCAFLFSCFLAFFLCFFDISFLLAFFLLEQANKPCAFIGPA